MVHLVENMAFTGATPWHGLGFKLQGDESIDEWRVAAGLDWNVEKRQLSYPGIMDHSLPTYEQGQRTFEVPGQFAMVRNDTNACLGLVSKSYQIVQPSDVLEFYRDLTEHSGLTIETAGSLNDGKRVWALARTGDDFDIVGDKMKGYLLLATSFDGSMATTAKWTAVRVVCWNTMHAAMSGGDSRISISHRTKFDDYAVKQALGLHTDVFEELERDSRRLASVRATPAMVHEYISQVLGTDLYEHGKEEEKVPSRKAKAILQLSLNGTGQAMTSARGTLWGLVNAVTEYVDHTSQARSQSNRLTSAWFGVGDRLKSTAMGVALQLAA